MLHEKKRVRIRAWTGTTARRQSVRRCFVIPVLLLACYGVGEVHAAELGNITVHSWLGRQLKASVMLTGDDARQSEVRCFKGTLVNLNNEPVASLKVTLQHSAKGSILLLFGGNPVDEPAAMVRIENTCVAGAKREYALLLDQVPEALRSNAPLIASPLPEASEMGNLTQLRQTREADAKRRKAARKDAVLPDIVSSATGMMRLAAVLSSPQSGSRGRAGSAPLARAEEASVEMTPGAGVRRPVLKLAHTLGMNVAAGPSKSDRAGGTGTSINRSGLVAGVLSLLAFAGAAAWLVMRLREMKAASKPWMPIDAVLDSGEEQAEAVPAKQKL